MPRFTLMHKTLNLEQIEGKYSAFAKCHYALPVRLPKPLAKDGYGKVRVDGIEISQGKTFFMDTVIKMHMMLIPVGEVAREFDKEYTVSFEGFKAEDGSKYVKILKKAVRDGKLPVKNLRDNAKYVIALVLKTTM